MSEDCTCTSATDRHAIYCPEYKYAKYAAKIAELETTTNTAWLNMLEAQRQRSELKATIERVNVVRKELATQVLNGHAVKMLDKALKGERK